MKVVYLDGHWFMGERTIKETGRLWKHETQGTHHFTVLNSGSLEEYLVGQEVAVPISSVRYFVLNQKSVEEDSK